MISMSPDLLRPGGTKDRKAVGSLEDEADGRRENGLDIDIVADTGRTRDE
jgi:hypothetical protein